MIRITAPDPAQARDTVRDVLDGARFHPKQLPKPFRSPLRWIADRGRSVWNWFADHAANPVGHWFGSLPVIARVLIVALAVGAIVIVVARAVRERRRGQERRAATITTAVHEGIAALEAAAQDAERRGDYAAAVRLRFRAGLQRLDREAHAIEFRSSLLTRAVRDELGSTRFDHLADTHEEIAYAGRVAVIDDAHDASEEWPEVVREAKRP